MHAGGDRVDAEQIPARVPDASFQCVLENPSTQPGSDGRLLHRRGAILARHRFEARRTWHSRRRVGPLPLIVRCQLIPYTGTSAPRVTAFCGEARNATV